MTNISEEIAAFQEFEKSKLLAKWHELFHQPPPSKLRKELMVPLLAYRLQEREYSGLSHGARAKLKHLASTTEGEKGRPGREVPLSSPAPACSVPGEASFTRSTLTMESSSNRGKQFSSLSQIAREITGTRWSGPLFFGTRKAKA